MPRNVTLTFSDGSSHVYNNVPDDATPQQVIARAGKDFPDLTLSNVDGGKKTEVAAVKPQTQSVPNQYSNPVGSAINTGVNAIMEPIMQMGSSMIAKPVSDIFGLAATGKEMISPSHGGGDPEGFRRYIRNLLTYQPRGAAGQAIAKYNPLALIGEGVGALAKKTGEAFGSNAPGDSLAGATGRGVEEAVNQIPGFIGAKYAPKIAKGPPPIVGKAAELVDRYSGRLSTAESKATSVAKGALDQAAATKAAEAEHSMGQMRNAEDVRNALNAKLEATKANPPNLDMQGGTIRDTFNSAIKVAKDARSEAADKLFTEAKANAIAKEAAGSRVDVSAIDKDLSDMIKQAENIPGLEGKLNQLRQSLHETPVEALKTPRPPQQSPMMDWTPMPKAPSAAPTAAVGKTFEQLELTRRYLNDIAYTGELEGWPAILRNKARDTAKAVDKAMQDFVPEFKIYKETYKKNSESLESLNTRFGKALSSTEGGITEDAYTKISNSDLPNKLFSKKEGVDVLVDALAGGKNASPAAKQAASAQVDTMVENWILESIRSKSPAAAVTHLQAPGIQPTLAAVPKVAAKVTKQAATRKAIAEASSRAGKIASTSQVEAQAAAKIASKIKTEMDIANSWASQADKVSQQRAFDQYMSSLAKARRAGLIEPDAYKAAVQLMDRVSTLQKRNAFLKKVAWVVIGMGGLYGARRQVEGSFQ